MTATEKAVTALQGDLERTVRAAAGLDTVALAHLVMAAFALVDFRRPLRTSPGRNNADVHEAPVRK
jgi:hypothetical protein